MYLLHLKKNGIYANISLFLSYSEITVATRSSLYPDQMVTAVTRIQPVSRSNGGSTSRDDLYSPERQGRSGHLDEPQRQIPIEDLVTLTAIGTRPQEPDESFTQSNFAAVGIELLVWPEENWPPDWAWFLPRFFLYSVTDGVLVPCCCRLWLA